MQNYFVEASWDGRVRVWTRFSKNDRILLDLSTENAVELAHLILAEVTIKLLRDKAGED